MSTAWLTSSKSSSQLESHLALATHIASMSATHPIIDFHKYHRPLQSLQEKLPF